MTGEPHSRQESADSGFESFRTAMEDVEITPTRPARQHTPVTQMITNDLESMDSDDLIPTITVSIVMITNDLESMDSDDLIPTITVSIVMITNDLESMDSDDLIPTITVSIVMTSSPPLL